MTHPDSSITVGQYLAHRLRELGVEHLFGLPGDFNLSLLDEMLSVEGLDWVGTTNELNAAYAADAYGRVRRSVGALVTTYGVGELSAINGVAGAYAEDVPVIQITGATSTKASATGALLHHTLVDGDHGHFERAYREVTTHTETLRAETATRQIDQALLAAIRESKPSYISVPTDVAVAHVDASNLQWPLEPPRSDPDAFARFRTALSDRLASASAITVLAGPRLHRRALEPEVHALADTAGVRIASQPASKAILDESHPRSLGTYMGSITRSSEVRTAVDTAEPIILAGAVLNDVLTGFFSHEFDVEAAIDLGFYEARIGPVRFHGVRLEDALRALRDVVTGLDLTDGKVDTSDARVTHVRASSAPVSQREFWSAVQEWLPAGTTVIADQGTSFYGALELAMPDSCDLIGQPVWSSIGYTLPAVLGACLGNSAKRVVLFIGDGSAQVTVQELATILHRGLTPVIFLIDNFGYTVERAIQSPDAEYQDVTAWNWLDLPAAFGAADATITLEVRTGHELIAALELATQRPDTLVMVRVVMDRLDTPAILTDLAAAVSAANGPPAPEE